MSSTTKTAASCDDRPVTGYDVIGDVHGCADDLAALLEAMGYVNDTGVYAHATNKAVFVGDLIDRGPQQLEVLQIVRPMVDARSAFCIMGNHEFNAICYSIPGEDGSYLRPHSEKNEGQHRAFLEQLTIEQQKEYLAWFRTLPLWLDLGGLRVVHACWHDPSIEVVKQQLRSKMFDTDSQFADASTKGHPVYEAVETLLKGPEISLTDYGQPKYRDKGGDKRGAARIRWWGTGTTLTELAVIDDTFTTVDGEPYPPLPAVEVDARDYVYSGTMPVIYGHYWRRGDPKPGHDWTERTACVDFSAVTEDGRLTAYRWSGEDTINPDHYFHVEDA